MLIVGSFLSFLVAAFALFLMFVFFPILALICSMATIIGVIAWTFLGGLFYSTCDGGAGVLGAMFPCGFVVGLAFPTLSFIIGMLLVAWGVAGIFIKHISPIRLYKIAWIGIDD